MDSNYIDVISIHILACTDFDGHTDCTQDDISPWGVVYESIYTVFFAKISF